MDSLESRLKKEIMKEMGLKDSDWTNDNCGARKLAKAIDGAVNAYLKDYLKEYIGKLEVITTFSPPDSSAVVTVPPAPAPIPVMGVAKGKVQEKLI